MTDTIMLCSSGCRNRAVTAPHRHSVRSVSRTSNVVSWRRSMPRRIQVRPFWSINFASKRPRAMSLIGQSLRRIEFLVLVVQRLIAAPVFGSGGGEIDAGECRRCRQVERQKSVAANVCTLGAEDSNAGDKRHPDGTPARHHPFPAFVLLPHPNPAVERVAIGRRPGSRGPRHGTPIPTPPATGERRRACGGAVRRPGHPPDLLLWPHVGRS